MGRIGGQRLPLFNRMVMLDQDTERRLRDARNTLLVFGALTLIATVSLLCDIAAPALVLLAIQMIVIFVRVLNETADIRAMKLTQPSED